MYRFAASATLVLGMALPGAAQTAKTAEKPIVPPDAKLELLFTRSAPIKGGLTEGPAVAPDGSIYFSDIPFGKDKGHDPPLRPQDEEDHRLHRRQRQVERPDVRRQGEPDRLRGVRRRRAPGLALGREDGQARDDRRPLSGQAVQRLQRPLHRREGADLLHRPPLPGDRDRASSSTAPSTGSTPTAQVVEVTHDVEKPNGIALSPDQKTLYVADHNNGTDRIDPTAPHPEAGRDEGLRLPARLRRAGRRPEADPRSTSATRRGATA